MKRRTFRKIEKTVIVFLLALVILSCFGVIFAGVLGVGIALVLAILAAVYDRCPYCGRFAGRSVGPYCTYCGRNMDDAEPDGKE